jgi:hypothetical protein
MIAFIPDIIILLTVIIFNGYWHFKNKKHLIRRAMMSQLLILLMILFVEVSLEIINPLLILLYVFCMAGFWVGVIIRYIRENRR